MNEKGEGDGSPNEAKNNISANVNDQRRQRSNRRDNGMATGEVNASRFTGSTDGLEKYVYDIGDKKESAENFNRITMKIANYIATNVKDAGEFRRALKPDVLKFEELVIPTLTEKQKQDTTLVDIWRIDLKECREKMRAREEAKKQAFSIILGQCSMAVTDRLESSEEWESIDESSDVLQLLKLIRKSLYTRSTSKQHTHSLQEAQDRFMLFRQAGHMNVNTYFETFKSLYEAYEHLGGGTGHSLAGLQPFLKPKDPTNVTYQELKDAEKAAREEFLGIRLIRCSDPNRYAGLLADVENSYTRGVDGYPRRLLRKPMKCSLIMLMPLPCSATDIHTTGPVRGCRLRRMAGLKQDEEETVAEVAAAVGEEMATLQGLMLMQIITIISRLLRSTRPLTLVVPPQFLPPSLVPQSVIDSRCALG
ncbi:hypothetical protein IV203_019660 [Nitzschia inconspicua]|uniref:Uncharacterized protein n=1 Tax=Nitzschia inconspicua TaxID=303405 RepID=A0A9K3LZ37_9STRA|nr:hypothetical protein IV203_019660 [Nitzschia inconspicua]